MKHLNWQIVLGVILVILSVVVYFVHYVIFRDLHHIFIYLIGDIAFVFIEVLMVTLIIHQVLTLRDKKAMLKKLNMVIGAFFSEVGTHLLTSFSSFNPQAQMIAGKLVMDNNWSDKDFLKTYKNLKSYDYKIESRRGDLKELRRFLVEKRNFLLRLLENPNLLEHETFTNLLWAVFHLTDELANRRDISRLPDADYQHLAGDIKRAYVILLSEWLNYMKHLKEDYPYLFSLAMRTNPFDEHASVEVR